MSAPAGCGHKDTATKSVDHLVSGGKQLRGHSEAEHPGSAGVDNQLELRRLGREGGRYRGANGVMGDLTCRSSKRPAATGLASNRWPKPEESSGVEERSGLDRSRKRSASGTQRPEGGPPFSAPVSSVATERPDTRRTVCGHRFVVLTATGSMTSTAGRPSSNSSRSNGLTV